MIKFSVKPGNQLLLSVKNFIGNYNDHEHPKTILLYKSWWLLFSVKKVAEGKKVKNTGNSGRAKTQCW